jgi:quercetin dioxygenase-like cupin family protein
VNIVSLIKTLSTTGAFLVGTAVFAPAAFAGECPADKVGVDVTKPGATMPKDVTDTVIASIDLGKGYNIDGKTLRMRRLVVKPGGIVPWHSHAERPANIYVVEGSITEYRSTCAVPLEHSAGDVTAEAGNLSHWWKNNTNKTTTLISSDIVPTPMMDKEGGM